MYVHVYTFRACIPVLLSGINASADVSRWICSCCSLTCSLTAIFTTSPAMSHPTAQFPVVCENRAILALLPKTSPVYGDVFGKYDNGQIPEHELIGGRGSSVLSSRKQRLAVSSHQAKPERTNERTMNQSVPPIKLSRELIVINLAHYRLCESYNYTTKSETMLSVRSAIFRTWRHL